LENPETVANRFKNASVGNNVVPLAIMHYEYDKLDDDALKKGLVTYSGNRIQDIRGKTSPYIKKNLFAIAPQSLVFERKTVAFAIKSDLMFGNIAKNISKIEINFNNESGYRTFPGTSPLYYTFSSGGEKTIFFRLIYSDGSAYVSRTRIYVNSDTGLRAGTTSFTDEKISISANDQHSGGTFEIHYAQTNTTKKLRKPLIIAEPFDMSSILSVFPNYTLDVIINRPEIQSICSIIDLMEYDMVYVNYKDGLDDIFRNAALFAEAIRYVNEHKDKSATPKPDKPEPKKKNRIFTVWNNSSTNTEVG
jgi:hypothetical protein